MDLYVFSDESGVFDSNHNDYFVFAGLICFGKGQKERNARMYSKAEKVLRENHYDDSKMELKACKITNAQKGKMFRSLNSVFKFCVLIKEKSLNQKIFENKKHKQRYLDYAYKMVLKKCFQTLISEGFLYSNDVENIFVYVDEHTTATDGKYELRENLLTEFKYGTFNPGYNHYFDPIFPKLKGLDVSFCDSKKVYLIRAADIIANHYFHIAISNNGSIKNVKNTFVYYLPSKKIGNKGLDFFTGSDTPETLLV